MHVLKKSRFYNGDRYTRTVCSCAAVTDFAGILLLFPNVRDLGNSLVEILHFHVYSDATGLLLCSCDGAKFSINFELLIEWEHESLCMFVPGVDFNQSTLGVTLTSKGCVAQLSSVSSLTKY